MRKNTHKDQLIGQRLRTIRECMRITRKELAKKLGISAQQIQKYENGSNRISVSMLLRVSDFLKVPIWDFIEDEKGNLIDSQEQRALYYWRSLSHPKLQNSFIDLMQCVNQVQSEKNKHGKYL